jgi:hypothetical protein
MTFLWLCIYAFMSSYMIIPVASLAQAMLAQPTFASSYVGSSCARRGVRDKSRLANVFPRSVRPGVRRQGCCRPSTIGKSIVSIHLAVRRVRVLPGGAESRSKAEREWVVRDQGIATCLEEQHPNQAPDSTTVPLPICCMVAKHNSKANTRSHCGFARVTKGCGLCHRVI